MQYEAFFSKKIKDRKVECKPKPGMGRSKFYQQNALHKKETQETELSCARSCAN